MTRGSPDEPLHIYLHAYAPAYMHCISTQQNCLMVKCFSKCKVISLLSFDHTVAMLRANGHDNVLTVKIATPELMKKTVDVTN